MDMKAMARRASKCWLFGIWMSILCALLALIKAAQLQGKLLIEKSRAKSEHFDQQKWEEQMKKCAQ